MTSAAQRAELQAKIWKIANDIRGPVDGLDFKHFLLSQSDDYIYSNKKKGCDYSHPSLDGYNNAASLEHPKI